MIDKIKVGMYVRTKRGFITKASGIDEERRRVQYDLHNRFEIFESDVASYSFDILDLITEGDYVNGYKVSFKDNDYKPFVQCDYRVQEGTTNHYRFYEEDIKSILTKEVFETNSYKVCE